MKTHSSVEREQGQAIIILALAMVALLAFAALAIDGGNTYVERRRAQNAADAGALAGARELWLHLSSGNSSETTVVTEMNKAAESNGVADAEGAPGDFYNPNVVAYYTDRSGNKQNIEVGATGSIPPNAEGVQVTTKRMFGTFIAGIFNRGSMAAEAQATAVIIPPPTCGDFAIYAALQQACNKDSLSVTGSNMTINGGGLYSGSGTHIDNTNVNNGTIYSVCECGPAQQCSRAQDAGTPIINNGQPQTQPTWDFSDFRPGGSIANSLGSAYHYVDGNLNSLPAGDGLYYVTGNVQINGAGPSHVTIVSAGTQKYNGTVNLSAYYHDLLFFSNSNNTTNGAIQVSASDSVWEGLIYAPNGDVNFSAAQNLGVTGAIFAQSVSASGSQMTINYDPATCPPTRARVILLK